MKGEVIFFKKGLKSAQPLPVSCRSVVPENLAGSHDF